MKKHLFFLLAYGLTFSLFAQVSIISPKDGTRSDYRWLEWDFDTEGSETIYQIVVKQVHDDQSLEEAMEENDTTFFREMEPSTQTGVRKTYFNSTVELQSKYVWQVAAILTEQSVTLYSDLEYFNTAWVATNFYASSHKIVVDTLYNKDIEDLSGIAKVRLDNSADNWTPFEFNNIELKDNGGYYVLGGGEIAIDSMASIEGVYMYDDQFLGDYQIKKHYLTREDGLTVLADLNVQVPFFSEEVHVQVNDVIANFNGFKINGYSSFEGFEYNISNDFHYKLDSSSLYINSNRYWFIFEGELQFYNNGSLKLSHVEDLSFWQGSFSDENEGEVELIENTKIGLEVKAVVVDLLGDSTYDAEIFEPEWQGIFVKQYDINIPKEAFDNNRQVSLANDWSATYSLDETDTCWITTASELKIFIKEEIATEGQWYHYASEYDSLVVLSDENGIENSYLSGTTIVPFLSADPIPLKIPISSEGYDPGILNLNDKEIVLTSPFLYDGYSSSEGFIITWFPMQNVEEYQVYVSNDNFVTTLEGYDGLIVQDTVIILSELSFGKTHQVKIVAEDSESYVLEFEHVNIPRAPSILEALIVSDGTYLKWVDNSDNEGGFIIEEKIFSNESNEFEYVELGRVESNVTQFLDVHVHSKGEEVTYRVVAYNENGRSQSELTIEKLTVLSVQEGQLKNQISIYPNPFSDQFKLLFGEGHSQSDTYNYVLTDYLGRRIKKGTVYLNQLESELNGNQVSAKGLYYLQLINLKSAQQTILKIIKN